MEKFSIRDFLVKVDENNNNSCGFSEPSSSWAGIGEFISQKISGVENPRITHAEEYGQEYDLYAQYLKPDLRHLPQSRLAETKLRVRLQNCAERAMIELQNLSYKVAPVLIGNQSRQIAALATYAAHRMRYNHPASGGGFVGNLGNWYTELPCNAPEAYSQGTRYVVDYLNNHPDIEKLIRALENSKSDNKPLRIKFKNVDDSPELENGTDYYDLAGMGGTDGEEFQLEIDIEDFNKYIDHQTAMFNAMSRAIDFIPALSLTTQTDIVEDDEGEDILIKELDPNRIIRMTSDGYAALAVSQKTYFPLLAANGDLRMRVNARTLEHKHVELVMLDGSGSMETDCRAIRAIAYMINRLDKVIEGRLIVAFGAFSDKAWKLVLPNNKWIIDNPEDARAAKDCFYNDYTKTYRPGGTNIPVAVEAAYSWAAEMSQIVEINDNVHITFITDDDSGSGSIRVDKNYVINALVVDDNNGMRKASQETGGVYLPLVSIPVNPGYPR